MANEIDAEYDPVEGVHILHEATYCAISINSATPVTRYTLAEILVSALCPGHRYISQKIRQVTTGGPKNQGIRGGPAKVFGTLPK